MPKFLYPGTHYLGPGNPYPNGPTTSSADEIAKRHDKSYIDAKSEDDIKASDWEATKEFASDFVSNPSLQSASGAIGLGAKSAVESVTGVIYPNMSKRGHEETQGGAPIKKHQSGTISSSEDMAAMSSGTGGGKGVGNVGVERHRLIFKPMPQEPEYITRTLRKTYHFFSKNDLPSYQKVAPTGAQNIILQMNYIQSPPVDRLRMYMSPREEALFREQFTEVNCDRVNVQIYSLGARGQFISGGTTATNANMQLQPFIAEFKGIDKHFPTEVTDAAVTNFLNRLEGNNPYNVPNAPNLTNIIDGFPARSGSRRLECPLRIIYPNPFSHANNNAAVATSAVENRLNFPNIYEYAEMQNGAILAEGTPTFEYDYEPKNKYLFGRNNFTRAEAYIAASAAIQPFTLMQTPAEFTSRTQDTQSAISAGTNNQSALVGSNIWARNQQPGDIRIENQFQHNGTEMFKPHRMPRFNFGVMPLRNAGDASNQEIQWEYLMVCTIKLRCKMGAPGIYGHDNNFPEPMYMYPTIQKGSYGSFGAVNNATDTGTQIVAFNNRRNVFGRPTYTGGVTVAIPQGTGSTSNNITPAITRSRSKALQKKRQEESEE